MNWESSLREQLNSKIKPWANFYEKPPYSEEQMVVIALVDRGGPLTNRAIYEWLIEKFGFYRRLAANTLWKSDGQRDMSEKDDEDGRALKYRLLEAFCQSDLPIRIVVVNGCGHWNVSTSEARIYLKPILQDDNEIDHQCFPFMRLPSEIRLRIYELVLALPRVGVRIYTPSWPADAKTEIQTVERALLESEPHKAWFDEPPHNIEESMSRSLLVPESCLHSRWVHTYMRFARPAALLALFLANRTIYEEAMPVFFDMNLFVFMTVEDMVKRLGFIPISRRKRIRHILVGAQVLHHIGPPAPKPVHGPHALADLDRILDSCTGLAKIDVYVYIDGFWRSTWGPPQVSGKVVDDQLISLARTLLKLGPQRIKLLGESSVKDKLEAEWRRYEAIGRVGQDMICG